MLRLFDYISNWIGLLFIIWFILKQTKSRYSEYANYINPYYGIYFIFYGYILYVFVNLSQGIRFNFLYIIFGLITHYTPIYLFNVINGKENKYSLTFFIIVSKILNKEEDVYFFSNKLKYWLISFLF